MPLHHAVLGRAPARRDGALSRRRTALGACVLLVGLILLGSAAPAVAASYPPAYPPTNSCTVSAHPVTGHQGQVNVVGSGFAHSTRVNVTVSAVVLASPVTDSNGAFQLSTAVPSWLYGHEQLMASTELCLAGTVLDADVVNGRANPAPIATSKRAVTPTGTAVDSSTGNAGRMTMAAENKGLQHGPFVLVVVLLVLGGLGVCFVASRYGRRAAGS